MSGRTSRAAAAMEPPLPLLLRVFSAVGSSKDVVNEFFEWFGDLGVFLWRVAWAAVTPPFEFRELFRQLDEVGSKSLPLVALAGGAIGVVLSLETRYSLTRFGAKSLLPAAIVFSVIHEIGPIITGLVVSGRVGAGIGAELASMKVTEQIDAMRALGTDPVQKLVTPRLIATCVVLPLLTIIADFVGVFGGWVIGHFVLSMASQQYWTAAWQSLDYSDITQGLIKPFVFAFAIALVGCYYGLTTTGGTQGVGRSTTQAMVVSSVSIVFLTFFITRIFVSL